MPSSNPANAQIAEVAETRRLTQCCVRLFQYVLHIVAIRVIVFDMAASSRKSAAAILKDALRAESHESLAEHRETIEVLRGKDYSWRDIAQFLVERGVETDHTKIFRFMKQRGRIAMSPKVLVVPSAEKYVTALESIKDKIGDHQMEMLRYHFNAHNRTATFGDLGRHVGYKNEDGANLHYGKLGALLGETVGMEFDRFEDGTPFLSSAIGSGSHFAQTDTGHFQLIMHHELAKALDQLGWFQSEN